MTDDDLRARLAGLDPMPASISVDPLTSLRAQELLEHVMTSTDQTTKAAPMWRRPALLASAAVAVVALGVGAVVAANSGGSTATPTPKSTLALKVADSGGAITSNSCMIFSVDLLRGVPVAFGGTVTDLGDGSVTIAVDKWFKGGTADVVTIATPPLNTSAGTVEFVKGKRYLVTATNGTVNSCGLTGEATPDFEKSFEEAF